VFGALLFIWIIVPAFMTTMGAVVVTDIVKGMCVPWAWHVCTLGRVRRLRGWESNHFNTGVVLVPVADDSDRFLLLQNCSHTQTQGTIYYNAD